MRLSRRAHHNTARRGGILIAPRCRSAPAPTDIPELDWLDRDSGEHGVITAQNATEALPQLAGRGTILLLPGDAVSHFHVAAPRGIKRSEWPLLLEEPSGEDVHALRLYPLLRGRDHLELLALPAAELEAWRAWVAHLGLSLEGWTTAFMALTTPDTPELAVTLDDGDHRLFKGCGEAVAPSGAATVQWLAWPREWPAPPAWQHRRWQDPGHGNADPRDSGDPSPNGGAEAFASAASARRRSLAWLTTQLPAPFAFDTRGNRRSGLPVGLLPGRRAQLMGAALVLLAVLNMALWLAAQFEQRYHLAQHSEAALAARFIGPPPADAERQLAARRDALDALALRNRRLGEAIERADVLLDDPRWQLSRLTVSGQRATLGWRRAQPPAPVIIERARQRLDALGTPQWQPQREELTLELSLAAPQDEVAPRP
ncbi:hypothetical protein [Kushneria aurantia]|uniref:General secretion pathway protein L n=1 Tax=Kushneria aurantia TaxID=504092 RepID=A0ABV6G5C3_9GAMM|nr:hypothetical protein [Kushneria aurantia]